MKARLITDSAPSTTEKVAAEALKAGFRHVSAFVTCSLFALDLIFHARLTRPSCTETRRPAAGPFRTLESTALSYSSRPRSPRDQWDILRRREPWTRVCERQDMITSICTSIHLYISLEKTNAMKNPSSCPLWR